MEWSKAKNLIILLLAAVNVFLLCNLLYLVYRNAAIQRSTVTDLVDYLDQRGVTLDPEVIPKTNPGRTVLVVERDAEQEAGLARTLLEDSSLAANDDGSYQSDKGSLSIRFGGYVSVQFREPMERGACVELLERSGIDLWQPELTGSGELTLAFGELPLFNCRLQADSDAEIGALTGRVCVGSVLRTDSDPERDIAGLLVGVTDRLTLAGVTELTEIGIGWMAGSISNVGLRLTPAYRLGTNAGDFYINAVDGVLMSIE